MSNGNNLKCPICKTEGIKNTCKCGYDPENDIIADVDDLRRFYNNYKITDWIKEVKFVNEVHKFQCNKNYAWKLEKTAKFLGLKSKSQISDEIQLSYWLDYDPRLAKCDNKSQAKKNFKRFKDFYPYIFELFDYECDLQNYLVEHWELTPFYSEWELPKPFNTKEVGKIDMLSKQKNNEDSWHIIEIKKEKVSADKVVGQILRYMGWVKKHKADENGHVEGTIITGFPPDLNIEYALYVVQNLEQISYFKRNNEVKFLKRDDEWTKLLLELKGISFEERLEMATNFRKKSR